MLSRTQAGSGRTVKQEQEQISRNHVQTFIFFLVLKILGYFPYYIKSEITQIPAGGFQPGVDVLVVLLQHLQRLLDAPASPASKDWKGIYIFVLKIKLIMPEK